jgi:murein DD-endopeptidase MepM/ murein hydrolase activator NlpD
VSLRDLVLDMSDLTAAGAESQALVDRVNGDLGRLHNDQTNARAERDQRVTIANRLDTEVSDLSAMRSRQEATSGLLAEQIARTRAELTQLPAQDANLAIRIADQLQGEQQQLLATAEELVWVQAQLWLIDNQVVNAPPAGRPSRYPFAWPIAGAIITQPFGPTQLAIEPAYSGFPHFHTGVDLAAPVNSPVTAAAGGVVAATGTGDTGYGDYVVLSHGGGVLTLYGHLSQILAAQGDSVTQGQEVGLEGSTGSSTGPHLHFEVRVNDVPVNPLPYLPPGPPGA